MSMSFEVALIVIFAAALNAGWNALIKVSGDKIASMAVVTFMGAGVSAMVLPFVDLPDPASWPLLALAIVLHTAYHFVIPIAYRHGDLGLIYPISRGSAPLLVTLGAAVFAGESLGAPALLGVFFLSVGVMTLALDRKGNRSSGGRAVPLALLTGLCIAAYTLVDGLGARQAGSVMGFAVVLTIGDGLLTFAIAMVWKSKEIGAVFKSQLSSSVLAGGMQVGSYWMIIWAMALAPLSTNVETSVLFAALISTFVLKEGFGVWLTRYKP